MLTSALSLFLLHKLPFARFDFPRWQAWAALIVIGLLVGLDPSMRAGTPEMPGMPLPVALVFGVVMVLVNFLVIAVRTAPIWGGALNWAISPGGQRTLGNWLRR